MYNRFVRGSQGTYTRIPEEDGFPPPQDQTDSRKQEKPPPTPHGEIDSAPSRSGEMPPKRDMPPPAPHGEVDSASSRPGEMPPKRDMPPPGREEPPRRGRGGTRDAPESVIGLTRRILDSMQLQEVDTGDLLLLCLLFLLYEGGADEETLAALVLLLIL